MSEADAWTAVRIRDADINTTVKIRDARIKELEVALKEALPFLQVSDIVKESIKRILRK